MTITENRTDSTITISVEGRIETNTSPKLQESILKAFQKGDNVVIDFEKCAYLSSAGLRALLIGQKTANSKGGTMKLIHVPELLMNVFKMSGFLKILIIE